MKSIFTILIFAISTLSLTAQDIIVKNDKTEIKAKIEEITETTIKYKKIEMLDGPSYNINKRDVFMIIYKNGTKGYMETTASQPVVASPQPQSVQENRQPTYNQGGNGNNINSQNNNASYSNSELIVPRKGVYYYKEEMITSWKDMITIFEEHNAQESISIMRKRKTLQISGLALSGAGVITYLAVGRNNFGVGMAALGVALGGTLLSTTALGQPKKAVAAYNNMINNGRRTSFVPTFNSDSMGNHIGIVMRF